MDRLRFAKKYRDWTFENWKIILFRTNLKLINIRNDERHQVRRLIKIDMYVPYKN